MSTPLPLAAWLMALAQRMGAPLRPEPDGSCTLRYADTVTLVIAPDDSGQAWLRSPLFQLPDQAPARRSLVEVAMRRNLLGLGTRGAALCLEDGILKLIYPLDAGNDSTAFVNLVGEFAQTARELAEALPREAAALEPLEPAMAMAPLLLRG